MPTPNLALTRDQMREVLQRQRAGYEQMEIDRLRKPWREPTDEEKLAFDQLMMDVLRHRGPNPIDECGMVEWYRSLLRNHP